MTEVCKYGVVSGWRSITAAAWKSRRGSSWWGAGPYIHHCAPETKPFAMSLQERLTGESQNDTVKNQATKSLSLKRIEISGGDFSNDFYSRLVSPALASSVVSLGQLQGELVDIQQKLLYTGLFQDIAVKLDLDESSATSGPALALPVKASVSLTQLPLFKYGSYSKSTDCDVACGLRYLNPNVSQNGDSLLVDINLNYDPLAKTVNRKIWDLTYLCPSWSSSNSGKIILNPTVSTIDAQQWASHQQYSVGALIGLQNLCWNKCGATWYTAGLSGSLRQVTDISNSASDGIRSFAGGDLKLGLQTHIAHDSRRHKGRFASSGSSVSLDTEISGNNSVDYSGSQKEIQLKPFLKSVFKAEGAHSFFFDNFTLGYNLETGFIKSLSEADNKLHISDKLFLGGQNSLLGFKLNSVGVKNGNDYIGGLSSFKADFKLFTRLPNSQKDSPLRLYNFFNIGDVYDFNSLDKVQNLIASGDLLKKSAMASGIGLSYKADNAILDLSYSIPLSTRSQDTAKPGLSFAVVLNFK